VADRSVVDWYVRICEWRSLGRDQRRRLWFAVAAEIERVQREVGNQGAASPDPDTVWRHLRVPPLSKLIERVSAAPVVRQEAAPRADVEPWPEDPRDVLAKYWLEIEDIVARARAKFGADEEVATAVASRVKEKLWAKDFRIVRDFRHKSSFRSYLRRIVERTFFDLQTERLGKWHYSAAAERLGPLAKALERLVHHDGYEAHEAIETLLPWHPETTREELNAIWQAIPARQPRPAKVEVDGAVRSLPGIDPDILDFSGERQRLSDAARAVVQRFLEQLPDNDRLLLQLHFEDGLKISTIARMLNVYPEKNLHRRKDQVLDRLRKELEKAGITRSEAADLYGSAGRLSIFRFAKKEQ